MEPKPIERAAWRSRVARALAALSLAASICGGVTAPSLASTSVSAAPAAGDRYAGMPEPIAYAKPANLRPTVRLQGRQRLYRFDAAGNVARERTASLGPASIFAVGDGPRTFHGRQYVQLSSRRLAGWWVAAPDAQAQAAADYSPEATVRLGSGVILGVRFYAGGTVRLRQPVRLADSATFNASERASFGGRQFVLLTSGPLAGRWVSTRRAHIVNHQQPISGNPDPPTSQPTQAPNVAPTAQPTTQPTARPTVAPTASPTASPTPAPTAAPAATWKGIVLLYPGTDVTYTKADGSDYHLQATMSGEMHDLVIDTLGRFKRSVGVWSANVANIHLDIVEVPHPITTLDSLGTGRYWVGPHAVEADLNQYAPTGSYDSILVVWQARDEREIIPVGAWGLSLPPGSWANGGGFSSIITPSYTWWWTNSVAPEEVFVHEWLHQVVYWNEQRDRLDLDLHAGPSYGYQSENGSWRSWLSDVMQGKVWDVDHYTGVSRGMWAADQPTRP